jgi:radical SAM superfamily enzyme YgiQ (UPF0313 family)
MKILLYNPDNGVTRNFMPHLWMFLLQALTPPEHEVVLIDGNSQPMTESQLVRFIIDNKVGLVGIGSMTRMIARAYRVADALRGAGVPVVMGGPHVTEMPDEALGRDGGNRHADAVALGEADETWPLIVQDVAAGTLQEIYAPPLDESGKGRKPTLEDYPRIPWDSINLDQFNRIPAFFRPLMRRRNVDWETFHIIPIESGRGCPYRCEFCTVTGFFGDSIRFRSNESIVEEMLMLKARAEKSRGKIAVFFVDDNLAINIRRTKELLRDIIAAGAQLSWVGQISANLLRDEELVDLIADSGGKWIFIGMESVDPASLAGINKNFSKPEEYGDILERLARRNVYAITSFIFGLDNDTPGVARRTLNALDAWPPVLPVFGQITPYPATPLYDRLEAEGRLTRPKHWLEFTPFQMAHVPSRISVEQVQQEVREAWKTAYSPAATLHAMHALCNDPVPYRISHLAARLFFRGIYFPQKGTLAWLALIARNWRAICGLIRDSFANWPSGKPDNSGRRLDFDAPCREERPDNSQAGTALLAEQQPRSPRSSSD